MKLLSLFLSAAIFSGAVFAIDFDNLDLSKVQLRERVIATERAAYETWVEHFFQKVDYFGVNFTESEIQQLNELIKNKPPFGNKYYNIWIQKFEYWVDRFGLNFTDSEKNILEILLRSKPEGPISAEHFREFIVFSEKWFDQFGRNFTATEIEMLNLFSKANSSVLYSDGEQAYDIWYSFYKKWYDYFSPNITESEQIVLDLVNMFKPLEGNNDTDIGSGYVQVRKLRIQGIINLINQGRYNEALSNLYNILE